MTESRPITADEAVAALKAAAWQETIREEAYEKAVETVREMAVSARDQHRTMPPSDVLLAIDSQLGKPRMIVHCILGSFGADWSLDSAITLVRDAEKVGWLPDIFGHELAALKDGKLYRFEVRAPKAVPGE